MTTFILLWNATDESFAPSHYNKAISDTANGSKYEIGWTFGTRKSGAAPGDRVFLLRQRKDRGILASGTLTDGVIYQEPKSNDPSRTMMIADVAWDLVLPVDERIPIEKLLVNVGGHDWNHVYSSGQQMDPTSARQLSTLWARHTRTQDSRGATTSPTPRINAAKSEPVPSPAATKAAVEISALDTHDGQGHLPVADLRKIIEDHAQDVVTQHLEGLGYAVEDTRVSNPYDCRATRRGRTIFVEAKGTQSVRPVVLVTAGEVAHARENQGLCALGIVTAIAVTAEGQATGGNLLFIEDWDPDDGDLKPTVFKHTPRAAMKSYASGSTRSNRAKTK